MADANPTQVTLKNVRLSFPRLFEPEASVEGGPEKYSAAFLVDPTSNEGKDNLRRMITAVKAACEAEWGDAEMFKKIKADRVCVGDGNNQINQETGEIYDGYHDMKFVKAASPAKRRPVTVDRRRRPVAEKDEVFYGGCYVNAVVRVYTVKGKDKGGNGVFASLEAVQFFADGEPFGAGPIDVESVFDDLDGEGFGDVDDDDAMGDDLDI